MAELLQAFTIKDLTLGALLGLAIYFILRGTLIPSRTYDAMVASYEARIAELSDRIAAERHDKEQAVAAAAEMMRQNTALIQKDDVATAALTSIHSLIDRHERETQP